MKILFQKSSFFMINNILPIVNCKLYLQFIKFGVDYDTVGVLKHVNDNP